MVRGKNKGVGVVLGFRGGVPGWLVGIFGWKNSDLKMVLDGWLG